MKRDDDYDTKERLSSRTDDRDDVDWEKKLPMLPEIPKGDLKYALIIKKRKKSNAE